MFKGNVTDISIKTHTKCANLNVHLCNKSKVGDYFAFVQNDYCAQIHEIIDVLSPEHRLPTWSSNVGQQKRNVLMLSKTKCIIDWADWITIGGPKKVQGTQSVKTNLQQILVYIDSVSS